MTVYTKNNTFYSSKCSNFWGGCLNVFCIFPVFYVLCCPCVCYTGCCTEEGLSEDDNICIECDKLTNNCFKCCCHSCDQQQQKRFFKTQNGN